MNEQNIVFDEIACAEFIFNKLIEQGIAVRLEDIRMIMDLEYEYGESIDLYPSKNESEEREPLDNRVLLTISKIDGKTHLHSEVMPEQATELLQEAIDTIKTFD